jgi:actin-related protein 9
MTKAARQRAKRTKRHVTRAAAASPQQPCVENIAESSVASPASPLAQDTVIEIKSDDPSSNDSRESSPSASEHCDEGGFEDGDSEEGKTGHRGCEEGESSQDDSKDVDTERAGSREGEPEHDNCAGDEAGSANLPKTDAPSGSRYSLRLRPPPASPDPTKKGRTEKKKPKNRANDTEQEQTGKGKDKMASQPGRFKEEQVLIICPGSLTTMAQLGCQDLTLPQHRFPTRMFWDDESQAWRPYFTYKRKKATVTNGSGLVGDNVPTGDDEEFEWVEDKDSAEGAVYPLKGKWTRILAGTLNEVILTFFSLGGYVVNMGAFLAFLDHVHSMLTTTYHNTPIMLMTSPRWSRGCMEKITRYIFEKTKTPALCLIHGGVASQWGLKWQQMVVIDIGFEKVDITCIHDSSVVRYMGLGWQPGGTEDQIVGGEVFTQKLQSLLKDQGFTYDMAEQLKKSPICEVLPYLPDHPNLKELPEEKGSGDAFSTTAAVPSAMEALKITEPVRPGIITTDADEALDGAEKGIEDDGVLDVATIVTSGQTKEFLAKKEKEKQERAKAKKHSKDKEDAAAAKPLRLPNSKRVRNVFHYEEIVQETVSPAAKTNGVAANGATNEGDQPPADGTATSGETDGATNGSVPEAAALAGPLEQRIKRVRRDIEVGLERFTFADDQIIDRIVTAIYRAVQGIPEMYMRPACWDHLVFVGNGSKIKGLKDSIMARLTTRHLISPSTATMFTSELPSNIATPAGTGAQTPTGSFSGAPHQLPTHASSSGVNPLLQAATTASLNVPSATPVAGSTAGDLGGHTSHHFHSQTPTSIKLAPMPAYLDHWTKHGWEEVCFLGCQIAARVAYCQHHSDPANQDAVRLMSLSRVDYK